MSNPCMTFTRTQIQAAIDAADAASIITPDSFRARRIDFSRQTCLAYTMDTLGDYAVFIAVVGGLYGNVLEFAHAARPIPFTPVVEWPLIRMDEPTGDQWDDMVAACRACGDLDDDGPCPAHERAPWDVTAPMAAATI